VDSEGFFLRKLSVVFSALVLVALGAALGAGLFMPVGASGVIRSAAYNETSVSLDGRVLALNQPLITVVDESAPLTAVNYMPVREVLEALGCTVALDREANQIKITTPPAPAAVSIIPRNVRVTLDGIVVNEQVRLVELPDTESVFVDADALMKALIGDDWLSGGYNAASRTFEIVTKSDEDNADEPFADGVLLRDLLNELGYEYEVVTREGIEAIFVEVHLGDDRNAMLTLPGEGETVGLMELDDNMTVFDSYLRDDSLYILKDSFIEALNALLED